MKTIEVEVLLMKYFDVRKKLIVPNPSWGLNINLHECDLLMLTPSGYATEIEIKISKQDLLNDKKKNHGHLHNHIKYFYYCVPHYLQEVAIKEIPERAGLIIISKNKRVKIIKKASVNKDCVKWSIELMFKLAKLGTMRIVSLKEKLIKNL